MIKNQFYFAISLAFFLMFILLSCAVMAHNDFLSMLDLTCEHWFLALTSPRLITFFYIVATLISPLTTAIFILLIAIYLWFSRKQLVLGILGLYFGGNALALLVKNIVSRPRPNAQLVIDTGYSFPSGHTISVFLFLCAGWMIINSMWASKLVNLKKIYFIVAVLIEGIVVISRLYLGNHYLTDVLGSLLLGVSCYYLYRSVSVQVD